MAMCDGITMDPLPLHNALVSKAWVGGHVWHCAQMHITKTNNKGSFDSAGGYMYMKKKKKKKNIRRQAAIGRMHFLKPYL